MSKTPSSAPLAPDRYWHIGKIRIRKFKIPGATIIVPLLIACTLNTFFPVVFKVGSFTTGMTQEGASALVGAFLLIIGTTISFKAAPKAAWRGAVIIAAKVVLAVVFGLVVAKVFNNDFLGLTGMVIIAAISGANNAMYAGIVSEYGDETDAGAVAITTLIVGPPVTMIALGAAGEAPLGWSLLGAVLPIIVGIIIGNLFPKLKTMFSAGLQAIIMIVGFSLGSTMSFSQVFKAGGPGILLGLITSVVGAAICIPADKYLTRGSGVAGAAISSTAGASVATPAAMAAVDPSRYGGDVLSTATAQVAACVVITAILTPIITSWVYKRNQKKAAMKSSATLSSGSAVAH
jgi:2-keto-3-deoxygluconate permease